MAINTAFIKSVKTENIEEMLGLLQNGADVNYTDPHTKLSAIQITVGRNNIKTVRTLLQQPNLQQLSLQRYPESDQYGFTPFHHAINLRRIPLAKLLQKHEPGLVNIRDNRGKSPLHLAVTNLKVSPYLISWLLSQGAEPNPVDNKGRTPLMRAAKMRTNDTAKVLLDGGAGENGSDNCILKSPLYTAIRNQNLEMVNCLIESGARTKSQQSEGQICQCGNLATVALKQLDAMREESICIAEEVIRASAYPASAEAIFEAYGMYVLKSWVGHTYSESVQWEIESGQLDITEDTQHRMATLLVISIANCNEQIADRSEFKKRFQWESLVFDRFADFYEDFSLQRLSSIALRKELMKMTYGNITYALKRGIDLIEDTAEFINMDWALHEKVESFFKTVMKLKKPY